MEKPIKPFSEVKVGDMAYQSPDAGGNWDEKEGIIVWKGNSHDLKRDYKSDFYTIMEEGDHDSLDDMAKAYDEWVVVVLEIYGETVYGYNLDPSSVVCFETIKGEHLGDVEYWDGYDEGEPQWEDLDIKDVMIEIDSSTSIWLEDFEGDSMTPDEEAYLIDRVIYYAVVHHYLGGKLNHSIIGAMVTQL